ncbi:MAG: penicillin-binding protein beta-lactamase class [Pseudonocardiales bacterium]|nr:penicillin-binding protein beta-lactamase class [Pseudonocardiales bacterium]
MTSECSTDFCRAFPDRVPFDGVVPAATGPSLASTMHATSVPAVSLAVVVDGKVAWSGAWGVTNSAARPVSTSTAFQAGSISKTVAAFCALQLVDRGYFGLDDVVNEIAGKPLLRTADDSWHPRVTVRQLLSHTAGINVGGYPGYPTSPHPDGREVIEGSSRTNTPPVRVIGIPGTRFSYSGGGFVVLQEVIAAATRMAFDRVAADVLFSAAGMVRSTYAQDAEDPDRASGHRDDGTQLEGAYRRYPEMAAAGLWTTATDLARFLTVLMRARRGEADALISPELAAQMFTPQSEEAYGLGIQLSRHGDREWFGHPGDTQGFEADLLGTSQGLGLAVMANADLSRSVINAVRASVARLHSWPAVPGVTANPARPAPAPPVGRYVDDHGRTIEVQATARGAKVTVDGQPPLPLRWDGSGGWTSDEVNVTLMSDGPTRVRLLQTLQHGPVPAVVADLVHDR